MRRLPALRRGRGGASARRRASLQQPIEHRMLLTATMCLLAAGAVMVYSASSARTLLQGDGDGTTYLVKYVAYGAVGFALLHVIARVDLAHLRRLTPAALLGAFALLVVVHIPGIGVEVNGARRWIGAGPVQFQPSELMKPVLVLYAAAVLAQRPWTVKAFATLMKPLGFVAGAAVLLVALQPDLGTALVLSFTMAALLVAAGIPMRLFGALTAAGSVLVLLYAVMEPYRLARLTTFLDPWADAGGAGFQSTQGQIAIGSGGLFGLGPGESVQKVFYLPEAHTDFILAVIGEELGVVGIWVLLLLYGIIGYAGLRTAKRAKGSYAKLVAAGLTSLILCQALLNCYTVLGLAPLTGVPLPFISSGSTSLIALLCSVGILLNIAGGGSAHLRALPEPRRRAGERPRERAAGADRGGRDGGARRAGAGGRRRAAG